MANTINAGLALDLASAKVLETLNGIPTPLFKIYDTDISANPDMGKYVNIKVFTPGTVQTKGSGAYADADAAYTVAPVELTEKYVTVDMVGKEIQDNDLGSFERQVAESTRKLIRQIEKEGADYAFAEALDANKVVSTSANYNSVKQGEVAEKIALAGGGVDRSILLNPSYFASLLDDLSADTFGSGRAAQDGIAGMCRGLQTVEQTAYTAGFLGVGFDKTAVVLGARGILDVADYEYATTVVDPVSGLPISIKLINDQRSNRKSWVIGCRYGFVKGNVAALIPLAAS